MAGGAARSGGTETWTKVVTTGCGATVAGAGRATAVAATAHSAQAAFGGRPESCGADPSSDVWQMIDAMPAVGAPPVADAVLSAAAKACNAKR